MFILHGNLDSPHYRTVMIVAAECGLLDDPEKFKTENVEWSDVLGSKDYEKHHPFKQQPWFEDTEAKVEYYETRAICKYLAMKACSPLMPFDPVSGIKFDAGCSVELSNFAWITDQLSWELMWNPQYMNKPTNVPVAEWLKEKFKVKLDGYERMLSHQKYVGGDKISLVDLFHVSHGQEMKEAGAKDKDVAQLDDPSRPHVKKWWDEISNRDSVKKVKAMEDKRNAEFAEKMEKEKAEKAAKEKANGEAGHEDKKQKTK